MKRIIFVFVFVVFFFHGILFAQEGYNCFTILAGKNATVDGSVLFGHNEDDWGNQFVNYLYVPRIKHEKDEVVKLKNGGTLPQVNETCAFLWYELPNQDFADCFMNEYGVVLASNQCPSREKGGEITDGGISYMLRRITAERAKSAIDAVEIIGSLVEKFGYTANGRSYSVADANEAWIVSLVRGKQWVAQRIPDNHVMPIPNYFTITTVDLKDRKNFRGSKSLIAYAIQQDWYNSNTDGVFNFRKAYASPGSLISINNSSRKWGAMLKLSSKIYKPSDEFPFSFVPNKKLAKEDLIEILRFHLEGTELDTTRNYTKGHPHNNLGASICNSGTRLSFVAQLRSWMPVEIGTVMWMAGWQPCLQPYTPWYVGVNSIPEGFAKYDYKYALDKHFDPPADIYKPDLNIAYWKFDKVVKLSDKNYKDRFDKYDSAVKNYEKKLFAQQADFEKNAVEIFKKDKKTALELLINKSHKDAIEALKIYEKE